MCKRLLIIQPSHYISKSDRKVFKTKRRNVVSLTLPYLAALVPGDWDVELIDEQVQDIDFDTKADVVLLTVWTVSSLRAYDICAEFKKRGVPVVMGGPHTFFYPDEAAEHCDAVAIGEGERLLPQIVSDIERGNLNRIYRYEMLTDLSHLPLPRYEKLNLRYYGPFRTFSVQTSRGCPFKCDFCSERFYLGEKYRCRPIEDVIEEIKHTGSRRIFFADSNFGGDKVRAMRLMEALIPLNIRWSTLWSLYLCEDKEFMDLAQRSGLLHVNIGMESILPETIKEMNKRQNKTTRYGEILKDLRRRGISYSLNFIFGWDNETTEVFETTLKFLYENKVPVAYFNVLTPEKGTPLYERLSSEGRVFNAQEIGRYPGQICYYKPKWCEPDELERFVGEMYRRFYSFKSMIHRLPLPLTQNAIASWVINLSQRRMAKNVEGDNNFDNY
jgi:radical SAM superfamily enzyme YgiQ (UPF0313 family)